MPESWREFFSSAFFMPHGHCYLWKPALVWLQVLSNGLIGIAYVAIFATLLYLVRRIRNIPFQWMYLCFATFIVTCGITHVFDVYVIWNPAYWVDGTVRAITAVASVGTAILLPPLVPKAIALADAAALSRERGVQLEQANRELGVLLERTSDLEQQKGRFFANVSHELRTPLALVLGPTERLLAASNLTDDQRRDVEEIRRNARTLTKHVNDLLDVSKIEAGKMSLEYVETDLAALVRGVAAAFQSLAEERSTTLEIETTPTSLPTQVDPEKLQQIVLTLLSNAFKFSPRAGRIRCSLRVQSPSGAARIEVADSGPGIRPEHRARIFERFRQGDGGSMRRFGDRGLSLAIAKDLVDLHRGSISVADAPEGGALFVVELPTLAPPGLSVRAQPPTSETTDAKTRQVLEELRSEAEAMGPRQGSDRPLVLIVGDDADLNRFIGETLEGDYRIAAAVDGEEGLRRAVELVPDLIVTDVTTAGLGGDDLVGTLRGPQLPRTPILVLSVKPDDELRMRCLRDGAQDYLLKPFSPDELRVRAANLVTVKRARDLLHTELSAQTHDLESLAREVTTQNRDLANAVESMRVACEQALRASQGKTAFLSMVSHEFRTPVAAVELQLERLRRELAGSVTEKQSDLLKRMAGATRRLAALIESLLKHAQIESGRLLLDPMPFDLRATVLDVIDELQPRAEHRGLQMRVNLPPALPTLDSDPRLVRLILVNLVENAIKYTPRGSIEVSAVAADGSCRLTVRDTGPGIPKEMHHHVFEPFVQLVDGRDKRLPGIGLGLPLVKEMAEALGGRVELDSASGQGTTFSVVVPHVARPGAPNPN